MQEIICKSQAELDAVPTDYDGRVIIEFGTPYNRAVVNKRFKYSVVARENSSVVARGNSSVVAWDNSSVEARENSSVVAWDNSSVEARENSSVEARENSSVEARGNSSVVAWENSSVEARENSSVEAWENSSVVAWENSSVVARGNSSVVAWENSSVVARENSSVVARENSSVVAWGNSSVVAWGNSQACRKSKNANISTNGNSREVCLPSTITEYADYYCLPIDDDTQTIKLYKAVHRQSCENYYISDFDPHFCYEIGATVTPDEFDDNVDEPCGSGIHLAYLAWALAYGHSWLDLAILECECRLEDVLVPTFTDGKVRARKAKVLREVPLEECGLPGKILAKRMAKNEI